MATTTTIAHGTTSGYQQHVKQGETPCTRCREANTQYMRAYRAGRLSRRHKDRWWNNTRKAALEQLAAEHQQRFLEILANIRGEAQR